MKKSKALLFAALFTLILCTHMTPAFTQTMITPNTTIETVAEYAGYLDVNGVQYTANITLQSVKVNDTKVNVTRYDASVNGTQYMKFMASVLLNNGHKLSIETDMYRLEKSLERSVRWKVLTPCQNTLGMET